MFLIYRTSVVHSRPQHPLIPLYLHSSWESIPQQTLRVKSLPQSRAACLLGSTVCAQWLRTPIILLFKCLSLNVELRMIATTFPPANLREAKMIAKPVTAIPQPRILPRQRRPRHPRRHLQPQRRIREAAKAPPKVPKAPKARVDVSGSRHFLGGDG
jgi:hypothetical protein